MEVPTLRELFDLMYGTRTIRQTGYLRYLNWRIYGDEALAGQKASVWVMRETHTLTIAHEQAAVAEYSIMLAPDGRHLAEMHPSRLMSPQVRVSAPVPTRLWDKQAFEHLEWRKVYRVPAYAPRRRPARMDLLQLAFPALLAE